MKLATRRQVGVGGKFSRARPRVAIYPRIYDSIGGKHGRVANRDRPRGCAPFLAAFRNAFFLLAGVTHLFLQFDSAGRMGRARGVISPSILLMRGGTRYSACPGGQTPEGFLAFASRL